jgi:hypothetical protein
MVLMVVGSVDAGGGDADDGDEGDICAQEGCEEVDTNSSLNEP